MSSISSASEIRRLLANWYEAGHRDLPWRRTSSAYAIWLSEVILQQTRVEQGTDYYHRFLQQYPTIHDLANASEDEVLRLWQGLGYYSRARNLLKTARLVVLNHAGVFPQDVRSLLRLPGVGAYTAAAILSFAYDLPFAAVDGNIYRVISRLTGLDLPIDGTAGKKAFARLADELLDRDAPGRHNNAMMELGATLCAPLAPSCHECPISSHCVAHRLGCEQDLPKKSPKRSLRKRYFHFIELVDEDKALTVLGRRTAGDIWQGLYQPICIETADSMIAPMEVLDLARSEGLLPDCPTIIYGRTHPLAHLLTHQRIEATLYRVGISFSPDYSPRQGYFLVPIQDLSLYARPKLVLNLADAPNVIL